MPVTQSENILPFLAVLSIQLMTCGDIVHVTCTRTAKFGKRVARMLSGGQAPYIRRYCVVTWPQVCPARRAAAACCLHAQQLLHPWWCLWWWNNTSKRRPVLWHAQESGDARGPSGLSALDSQAGLITGPITGLYRPSCLVSATPATSLPPSSSVNNRQVISF